MNFNLPTGTVTFLTTDIVSFSEFFERDPVLAKRLTHQHLSAISELVAQKDGVVFKTVGDAVWAAFQSANSAVKCAAGLHAAMADDPDLKDLEFRVALLSGEAAPENGDYLDRVVNRCSRLCGICGPGQVLVGASTYALVKGDFEFRLIGTRKLRGVPSTEVWELLRDGEKAESDHPSSTRTRFEGPSEERPFVGRVKELEELGKLLVGPDYRLVSITGMGGIGKSRIARQIASDYQNRFPDGTAYVECESLSPDDLVASLSSAVDPEEDVKSIDELIELIDSRQMLITLDCFERLLEARPTVDKLIRLSRSPKFLVTSRIPLGLPRELEYRLSAMSTESKYARSTEASELFWEAAQHVSFGLDRGRRSEEQVGRIVELLEGVPLAIVLAASRLRHMTIEELLDQIQKSRLNLIGRKLIDGDDRHHNLIRVIGDSFDLLSREERDLIGNLSMFHGFFAGDAEKIIGPDSGVRDGIADLRDNSLIVTQKVGTRMRFRILDSIREFIQDHTDRNLSPDLRLLHARHYADISVQIREKSDAGRLREASDEMWLEVGNLREAIAFAVEGRDHALLVKFASSLSRPMAEAGMSREFNDLVRGLNSCEEEIPAELAIEMAGLQGMLAIRAGKAEEAIQLWNSQADLCRINGLVERQADTLTDLCDTALRLGLIADAEATLVKLDAIDHPSMRSGPLHGTYSVLRAHLELAKGQPEGAEKYLGEALESIRTTPANHAMFYVYYGTAEVLDAVGRATEASQLLLKTLDSAAEGGYTTVAWSVLLKLIQRAKAEGNRVILAKYLALSIKLPKSESQSTQQKIQAELREYGDDRNLQAGSGLSWGVLVQQIGSEFNLEP